MEDGPVETLSGNPSAISFRPLRRSDFPHLQKWLSAPHVAAWWNEPADIASIEAKYGPVIDGREPIYVYVIQNAGVAIGWIPWYRWSDFRAHAVRLGADLCAAGIDLAIGELEMTGRGLGPKVIREFGERHIFVNDDVCAIVADPATDNSRSVRAFRNASFEIVRSVRLEGESFERSVVRLERR